MKKILFTWAFTLSSSLYVYADYSDRGRLSDFTDHKSNMDIILPVLFIVGIVGIILYYAGKEYWNKHKDSIIENIIFIIVGIAIFLFLRFGIKSCKSTEKKVHNEAKIETPRTTAPVVDHTRAWDGYQRTKKTASIKENDFLVAVVNNPSYNIYDLIMIAGLNSRNTQFLTEQEYASSKYVRKRYTPRDFHRVYYKLSKAWKLLLRYQYYNLNTEEINNYMYEYDPFDVSKPNINDASNPQLIRALKTIPLLQ